MSKKIRKVAFLDIDGVLIPYDGRLRSGEQLDRGKFRLLHHLVSETGTQVVLSSSWRILADWRDRLEQAGWDYKRVPIIDRTPSSSHGIRGVEIRKWMKDNRASLSDDFTYVIIDDECDQLIWDIPRFVQIDGKSGLQIADIQKAAYILARKPVNMKFHFAGYKIKAQVKPIDDEPST